jgi:hypothetical protein
MTTPLTALCIGRHRFLSDHLAAFFSRLGLQASSVVGLAGAISLLRDGRPDVIICDYDLLAALPIGDLEYGVLCASAPVLAVSMTRRVEEMNLLDINGVGGFLYLPTLDAESARRVLEMTRRASHYSPTRDRRAEPAPHAV